MVELVEVEDESLQGTQPGPEENDEDYYTDTGKYLSIARSSVSHELTLLVQNQKSLPMMKMKSQMRHYSTESQH